MNAASVNVYIGADIGISVDVAVAVVSEKVFDCSFC